MVINGKKTKNYHKMSGAADSLYSQHHLFLPYRLMLWGQGAGVQLRSVVVPFATFTGWDLVFYLRNAVLT